MSDKPQILVADEGARRGRASEPPPPSAFAPVLLVGGLVLSLAGWVDVLLFYWPVRFGDNEWEFAVIAQTFDALPLPTLGLVLLALALRTMPERRFLARLGAVKCALIALLLLALLAIFALDVPVAFNALARATREAAARGGQANPLVGAGLKRIVAKALVLGLAYASTYVAMAVLLWRGPAREGKVR
jgi:hypothetical protein